MSTQTSSASSGAIPCLPPEKRHSPIRFGTPGSHVGEVAYPINYEELYNLKGRLLTLVDATFSDAEQRKAQKDLVWQALRSWMGDIEARVGGLPNDRTKLA